MEYHKIAEIEVRYIPPKSPTVKITNSSDVYNLALSSWNKDFISLFEEFKVILLNRGNFVLGIHTLSRGGITGTVVDLRLIFGIALKAAASAAVLVHNHPSGLLKPSSHDISITQKVKAAGELLDINIHVHIIISDQGYYSFSDEGIL